MTFLPSPSEPGCALKYYPEIEICVKEQKGEQEAKRKEAQRYDKSGLPVSSIERCCFRLEDENFGTSIWGKIRSFMLNLMEYPETSRYAQVRNQY